MTELHAGDIGAVPKLKEGADHTVTGDTLAEKGFNIEYPPGETARAIDCVRD